MCKEINKQRTQHAAKTLGVTDDYEIFYLANTEFRFLTDPESLVDDLSDGSDWMPIRMDEDDFLSIMNDAMVTVSLPPNFRIVGMAKVGTDQRDSEQLVYGVVDFSGLD